MIRTLNINSPLNGNIQTLKDEAEAKFLFLTGSHSEIMSYAPGRVNLIGEHTDYNQGFVFPCAINRGTVIAAKIRNDSQMNVYAVDLNSQLSSWDVSLPITQDAKHRWANYLRGVCLEFQTVNHSLHGMDIIIHGNIPQGAGLSSSASLSVAFATLLNKVNSANFSSKEIAIICQASENNFVGCKCGIMDQLVSALGESGNALFIDCMDLSYKSIPIPKEMSVIIIDSKVTRGLVDSEYNARRNQCRAAAKILGVSSLRMAELGQLDAAKNNMEDTIFRRARHVITENNRVIQFSSAMKTHNYSKISRLMRQSHLSMKNDFNITTPEIDALVDIVSHEINNIGGVRMTGGGFGGCVVALAPTRICGAIITAVKKHYPQETGLTADIHIYTASEGAKIIS